MKKERQKAKKQTDNQKSVTGWMGGWMDLKAGLRTTCRQSKKMGTLGN
jgi:hypothetical protein